MLDLLLFLITAWAATAAGRTLLRGLRLPDDATRLERTLFGYALGLGLLAYGTLALGLGHSLYRPAGYALLLVLAGVGAREHRAMAQELRAAIRGGVRLSPLGWGMVTLFAALTAIPMIGVWTPPTLTREWDSLSYHLADPKLYLQAHRIYPLPWESHSNFAFTAEMWYTYGMLLGGVPLAKLFHFSCGVGVCLGVYAFGARFLSPRVGLLAALLFGSTPLVLWEAGTAYADLAPTFFGTLTLLAVGAGMAGRDERWLRVGAVLMGLTLSTKATSLVTLALLALGLLVWRLAMLKQPPLKAVGALALWCLLSLAVGSPWYVKSTVNTGNPIYPFYYKIFGGRGFNADLARQYDRSNASFGVSYETKGDDAAPVRTPSLAALAPWNLTMYLLPGHPPPNPAFRPFNDFQWEMNTLPPVLLVALFFPAFGRGAPRVVKSLGLFALLSGLLWFATMQYARYLLPLLPVLCLLSAWTLARAWETRRASGYALVVLAACSVAFSLYVGASLVRAEAPVVFGRQSRDNYIEHGFAAYPAMQFINTQLPPNAKVVFYGNPMGFYCDKPYLWGDQQHSTVIPYDRFATADDLRAFLHGMGVTHVLINQQYFPLDPTAQGYPGWVYAITEGSGPPVFGKHGVAVYALPGAK